MQGISGSTESALAAHQCQILDFTLNLQVQGFRTGSVGSTDSAPGAYGGSVPGRVAGPPPALMTLAQKLGQGQGQAAGSAPVSNGPLFSAGQHRWAVECCSWSCLMPPSTSRWLLLLGYAGAGGRQRAQHHLTPVPAWPAKVRTPAVCCWLVSGQNEYALRWLGAGDVLTLRQVFASFSTAPPC